MKRSQFNTVLRAAVIAALPLATQVSCVNSGGTKNPPPTQPPNCTQAPNDPSCQPPIAVPGRMPNGLNLANHAAAPQSSVNTLGQYLADMTAMETAAITAFDYLRRELEAYNAPEDLTARARNAVFEEARHAEMAGQLSAHFDVEIPEVDVDDFTLRPLYDIAMENAVEGCVNETFAAACGLWQSENAGLDEFREAITQITEDEVGHAELSWDIHEWIMPQLSQAEQEQITIAQSDALEKLVGEFKQEGNPELQRAFGLPTRDDAARLFTQLKASVWQTIALPSLSPA